MFGQGYLIFTPSSPAELPCYLGAVGAWYGTQVKFHWPYKLMLPGLNLVPKDKKLEMRFVEKL